MAIVSAWPALKFSKFENSKFDSDGEVEILSPSEEDGVDAN